MGQTGKLKIVILNTTQHTSSPIFLEGGGAKNRHKKDPIFSPAPAYFFKVLDQRGLKNIWWVMRLSIFLSNAMMMLAIGRQ